MMDAQKTELQLFTRNHITQESKDGQVIALIELEISLPVAPLVEMIEAGKILPPETIKTYAAPLTGELQQLVSESLTPRILGRITRFEVKELIINGESNPEWMGAIKLPDVAVPLTLSGTTLCLNYADALEITHPTQDWPLFNLNEANFAQKVQFPLREFLAGKMLPKNFAWDEENQGEGIHITIEAEPLADET